MEENLNLLVKTLLNLTIDEGVRDDAAMDLEEYDDPAAIKALIKVALDENDDWMVQNSCGESIGGIWVRNGNFDKNCYDRFTQSAKSGVKVVVRSRRPEWLPFLEENKK